MASGLGNKGMTLNTNAMGALDSDGSGFVVSNSASILTFDNKEPFTFELWVNPSTNPSYAGLLDMGPIYDFGLSNGIPRLMAGSEVYLATQGVETGKWQHIAVSKKLDGDLRFYLDGHLVGQHAVTNAVAEDSADWQMARGFTGQLDELRVWSVARSAFDTRRSIRLPVDAADPSLALWYRFDATNGYDATFVANSSSNQLDDTFLSGSLVLAGAGRPDALPGKSLEGASPELYIQDNS